MTDAIPAATVLLLRDEPSFEVLMIERHADMAFAGGALVFPGGRIDDADSGAGWRARCAGLDEIPAEQHAPRIAAIREAFEETGLLLARKETGSGLVDDAVAEALNPWRKKVEADAEVFLDIIEQEKLVLACDALQLYARWSPPDEAIHRRYDTWFFAAKAPGGQRAREDGDEATEAIWIGPEAALKARETGERKMIFPTARNVELLAESDSAAAVFSFAAQRDIPKVVPRIVKRPDGTFVTIPSGIGYPVTEEPIETAFRF